MTYSEIFKDHLANPRNAGELSNATHKAEETNPVCGDKICLSLRVEDERIIETKFLAYGCPPTLVCASALTEMIDGMKIENALRLTKEDITKAIGGLPSHKKHAASLAIETLQAAFSL